MTDCIHYEKYMSRDEIALRLNIETALRECCESECAELKKELIEAKQKLDSNLTLLKGANANASTLSLENEKLKRQIEEQQLKGWKEEGDRKKEEIKKLKEKDEEIERLRERVANQKTHLNVVQQALLNRNMTIEALTGENDRLKKEVKETRVVFEPTSYLIDIQTKDEEIKALRKKNLDLKNENEGLKLKYDQVFLNKNKEITALKDEIEALKDALHDDEVEIHKTQPLYIENLNVTYYANGPIWTNEEDEDDISGSDDQN